MKQRSHSSTIQIDLPDVRRALALPQFDGNQAQLIMMPLARAIERPPQMAGEPRIGGVLALLYCRRNELYLVLTKRREDLNSHGGQVSFPGGRHEAPETLIETAIRETCEEIGVCGNDIEPLGPLTPIYILPSDTEVHPYVAWYRPGDRPSFVPQPAEVAEVIEAPLRHFLDPKIRKSETWPLRGQQIDVPFFHVGDHKVWGATAMMLSELAERLRLAILA